VGTPLHRAAQGVVAKIAGHLVLWAPLAFPGGAKAFDYFAPSKLCEYLADFFRRLASIFYEK